MHGVLTALIVFLCIVQIRNSNMNLAVTFVNNSLVDLLVQTVQLEAK